MRYKRIDFGEPVVLVSCLLLLLVSVCASFADVRLPASPFRTDDWPGVTVYKK